MITCTNCLNCLLYSLLIIALQYKVNACASNGICGSDPFCLSNSQSHPLLPGNSRPFLPHSSCQAGGCALRGSGYSCGPYGCYKTRIHGLTNFQPEIIAKNPTDIENKFFFNDKFDISKNQQIYNLMKSSPSAAKIRYFSKKYVDPNDAFVECCKDRQLPDNCLELCNFDNYSRNTLTNIFFKRDNCPMEAINEIQFCAAQGVDHSLCCQQNGVSRTAAGEKCLTFCDQRPGKKIQLDLTYLPCFQRFDSIKQCFKKDLINRNARLALSKKIFFNKHF